jgi:hypothetical protein
MRRGETKYKGEIMRQLSIKRWGHARPLAFKEIVATLDEAKQEFPDYLSGITYEVLVKEAQKTYPHRSFLKKTPKNLSILQSVQLTLVQTWFKKWFIGDSK